MVPDYILSECLVEKPGEGVFLAVVKQTKQMVVVKAGRGSLEAPMQLRREKEILNGPLRDYAGTSQLLFVSACDSCLILVERPFGTPLDDYVRIYTVTYELLCDWARQAMRILKGIHERGVVHRDIKPSNIIISRDDGCVYLIDFGFARDLTASRRFGDFGFAGISRSSERE